MLASFTPTTLVLIAAIAVSAALVIPPAVFNGVTAVEAGKHRVWFSRRGWVYDYDRHMAGTLRNVQEGSVMIAKSTYWSKSGNWPWQGKGTSR